MAREQRVFHADFLFFLSALLFGLLSLMAGLVFNFERHTMTGIAIGCLSVGVPGTVLTLFARRWVARACPNKLPVENDERSLFIRGRAASVTFWTLYVYLFLYTLLSPANLMRGLSHTAFGVTTLILMNLVYLAAVLVYSKRY